MGAMWTAAMVAGVIVGLLLLEFIVWKLRVMLAKVKGLNVVITGGSTGIGKALAEALALEGANVTIMARTESKLKAAIEDIKAKTNGKCGKLAYKSVDVTNFEALKKILEGMEKECPIDLLVTCAGQAIPGYLMDQDIPVFERHMKLNYFGTLNAIKAAAPNMVSRRDGHIVLVCSAIVCAPLIGYAAYAPSKFAVRGLADVLRSEFYGTGVRVSIAYPPDTESPGFENENKTKPQETKDIYAIAGEVFSAKSVANTILDGIKAKDYHISSPDFVQNRIVCALTAGVSPRPSYVLDMLLTPVWALIGEVFGKLTDFYARNYGKRLAKKKAE